jgi:NhaP-type Na+/H+ or K+/H+ antiporter
MGRYNISVFLVFFISLLALVLVLSKFRNDRPRLASVLPEGAMVLAVGMIAGFFIHLVVGERNPNDDDDDQASQNEDLGALLSFSPEIFFIALLPPIIFNSGLRIGALFVRHITPILLFATIGTTINAVCVGLMLFLVLKLGLISDDFNPSLSELMAFGALISSTDPVSTLAVFQTKRVNPQLFYLVFGESVLNDALAIVLFESFAKFVAQQKTFGTIAVGVAAFIVDLALNSVGSVFIGYSFGLGTAFLFKKIDMRHHRLVEISLYLVLMYVPFLIAEILHLSGIVTILFTGKATQFQHTTVSAFFVSFVSDNVPSCQSQVWRRTDT